MPLDLNKLQNVHVTSDGWVSACPLCRQNGADSKGNHLRIWKNGAFSCVVAPGDKTHNHGIILLAGDGAVDGEVYVQDDSVPQIELPRTWDSSVLARLIQEHTYWVNRGVKEEVLVKLRGGVATEGIMKGRYVFPIFDQRDDSKIIGFTGRAISDKQNPRWKHFGKVGTWVWGDMDEIAAQRRAVLVEGAGCRLALESRDIHIGLPLWGVNISAAVLGALIAANPERIDISLNNDVKHDVGQRAAAKVKATLDKFFSPQVARITLPPAKDLLDENMTEERWAEYLENLALSS